MVRGVATAVAIAVLVATFASAAWSQVTYQLPVAGPVIRAYVPPPTPYGHGHRGVDLAARPGAVVGAMADGVVGFAGSVAGLLWVSVDHADGLRTTVGPLRGITVARGDRVRGGEPIGAVGTGAHGLAGTLHLGVRRGDAYIDPMTILGEVELQPTLVGAADVAVRRHAPTAGRLVLVPGTPPSPHHLLVLAGLGSSTSDPPFDPAVLGYGAEHASGFSYVVDEDGRPLDYEAEHTWQRVHESALALQAQLRRRWADHPGQAVDLVGHSLGGLVAVYYLLVLHDPADPTLPPIGKVATIASPLSGTEAATAIQMAKQDLLMRTLVGLIDLAVDKFDTTAPVIGDLAGGSEVVAAVRDAWDRAVERPYEGPLATGTRMLNFGALGDPVVPAHNTDLPEAEHRMVFDTHGGAPTDAFTLATLEAYLGGQPLPGPTIGATVADWLAPLSHLIGRVELALPHLLG